MQSLIENELDKTAFSINLDYTPQDYNYLNNDEFY